MRLLPPSHLTSFPWRRGQRWLPQCRGLITMVFHRPLLFTGAKKYTHPVLHLGRWLLPSDLVGTNDRLTEPKSGFKSNLAPLEQFSTPNSVKFSCRDFHIWYCNQSLHGHLRKPPGPWGNWKGTFPWILEVGTWKDQPTSNSLCWNLFWIVYSFFLKCCFLNPKLC